MASSRTHNSIKNAAVNMIGRLVALICSFVIRTLFLKYLGDQYTGVSSLFTDILNVLSFTELGIGTAISFSMYKPIAEHDHYRIAQLMKLYKYVYLVISGAVLLLGISLIPFLDVFVKNIPDIKEDITVIYVMYVMKTSLSYLLVYKATFVIAKQKQYVVTGIECTVTALKTILDVVILIATKSFLLYLTVEILRVVLVNIIISIYADKDLCESKGDVKVSKSDARALFNDAKNVFIYKVSGIVLNSTDSMILSHFVNIASVTFLSNYNLVINAINAVVYQITSAMTASVGNFAVSKSGSEQKQVFSAINFFSFIVAAVGCCGIWLCIDPFITMLWGENYLLNRSIVALLCVNTFIINMHLSVDLFRTANGIFRQGRLRPLATAIINLVVSIVAVQHLGVFGVLLGTVVSRITTQVWYDPKLIFNAIFGCSVKQYYVRYLIYFATIVFSCFIGTLILNLLPANAVLRFAVGGFYSILFNIGFICICFRKTAEYMIAKSYLSAIFLKRK